ncbi:MlaD family protein [Roseicyclus amphidinii]|uniref:MlaD family protein n=1 Tax=Roseicyclus amphidinii TaxID=3034232 RepID=UPI0024E0624A|nr:MlaD family protein [Roseicyclus sp. Amp-Y-6]
METKANYLLIGLFALAGMLGILGFFLWLARVELDRQFAYYDVRFASVAGLSAASDVRFSGLPVGQVVDVRLAPERDGTILVRLEVDAETPVRADSIATIEAQGVTGISFVGIGPGSADSPLLDPADGEVPEIAAGRSTLQTLTEDAPELITETLRVVQEIGDLFSGANEGRLERIIANVETASEEFVAALDGISGITTTVTQFTEQINRFNSTLDALTRDLSVVLSSADETLQSIDLLADQATAVVASGTDTLNLAQGAIAEGRRYVAEDLSALTDDVAETLAAFRGELAMMRTDASALMATLGTTGTTATARLEEAEATLARIDGLIGSLDTASAAVGAAASRIDGLIEDEGAPLLSETRAAVAAATETIATINATATTDLPALMEDVRAAAETARGVITSVGADLSAATSGLPELVTQAGTTMGQVSDTFAEANATLAAINAALETGQRTLVAAERAFDGADRLINDEMEALVADLRGTVAALTEAVGTVAGDLPLISADLRAASQAATESFAGLQGLVDGAAPGISEFTTTALPLYTRLATETRTLIRNLDALTETISRNPAQFLLNRDVPEFRR